MSRDSGEVNLQLSSRDRSSTAPWRSTATFSVTEGMFWFPVGSGGHWGELERAETPNPRLRRTSNMQPTRRRKDGLTTSPGVATLQPRCPMILN